MNSIQNIITNILLNHFGVRHMKSKIFVIIFCMLFITSIIPVVDSQTKIRNNFYNQNFEFNLN
jgi:hypothetical protein